MARKIAGLGPNVALVVALALRPFDRPPFTIAILRRRGHALVLLALGLVRLPVAAAPDPRPCRPAGAGPGLQARVEAGAYAARLDGLLGQIGTMIRVTVFQPATGSKIRTAIVAMDQYHDPSLLTLMVGLGILLSFLLPSDWWWLIEGAARHQTGRTPPARALRTTCRLPRGPDDEYLCMTTGEGQAQATALWRCCETVACRSWAGHGVERPLTGGTVE